MSELHLEQIQASHLLIEQISAGRHVPAADLLVAMLVAWRAEVNEPPFPQISVAELVPAPRPGDAYQPGEPLPQDIRRAEVIALRQRATLHHPQSRPRVHPDYRALLDEPLELVLDTAASFKVAVVATALALAFGAVVVALVAAAL